MRARIILTAAAAALLAAGCGSTSTSADGGDRRVGVVASFYPLAYAVERVAGDRAEVTNLTPPGAEPHDVELSARDVERIHSAELVVYLGGGFQPALEDALAGADVRAVDLLEGLELRGGAETNVDDDGAGDEPAGGEGAPRVDPHVWLDPLRYGALVRRVGTELAADEVAAAVAAEAEELHAEYERGLADCARRELVTSHAAFGYLAERYDLEQVTIGGLAPEAEPAARELEHLIEAVRDSGATTVFVEPLVSPRVAETVARATRARTAVLNPLEGLTQGELAAGANYFTVMRENLTALREALGCR